MTDPRFERFRNDVRDEPATLTALLHEYGAADSPLIESGLRERSDAPVIFAGMGSSRNGTLAAEWWLRQEGVPAWTAYGADVLPGTLPSRATLVAVSKSGVTPETLEAVDRFRSAGGGLVVGVTNHEHSPLADECDVLLPLLSGAEGPISTKSYSATVAVGLLIAGELTGRPDLTADALRVSAESGEELLASADGVVGHLADELSAGTIQVLASGPQMAAAVEGAVIFKEGPALPVEALNAAEWLHGAYRSVHEGRYAAFLLRGALAGSRDDAVRERVVALGGRIVTIGQEASDTIRVTAPPSAPGAALVEHLPLLLAARACWEAQRPGTDG